ncbi:conserved Plasmodium protein, unknown function [Plasmodium sp. gorilla clade G2]|uniref:conserved Plasmodium protein, unknown function n=1 Tax=Plasmodium sp. gorilla clade G2 TaxID=880535 RepID=UPI000D2075F3|nr:conserved Plasmodium protein, unknown function [Plasmodium sp. gorilla clade G2]SOV15189.1 conserved Plasmodium protein, unknown function [Plasmodium sp. gorilla clade G2]
MLKHLYFLYPWRAQYLCGNRKLFYFLSGSCCYRSDINIDKIIKENKYEHIKDLRSQELRILSENCCVKKVNDVIIWSEISRHSIEKYNSFKYFDALLLLSSFDKMNIVDKSLYKIFSDVFIKQISYLQPDHFIVLINLYCKANIFPRLLFIEIFHGIIKYCNKLYPDEYVNLLICFANLKIVNKDLIKTLCKSIIKNINLFDYIHLTCIVGALRSLEITDDVFYYVIDEKQLKELKFLTVQEIFDHIKKIKLLQYSWQLYEKDIMKEFLSRLYNFKNEKDVDQLDDPFVCLNFLVSKGYLKSNNNINNNNNNNNKNNSDDYICPYDNYIFDGSNFLVALSKWCANQVYQYPSRSAKRPLSYELIKLYEIMKEYNIHNLDFIEKAIYRFVITRGGLETNRDKMFKPTSYQKGRKYIYTKDPLIDYINNEKNKEQDSYSYTHHDNNNNNNNDHMQDNEKENILYPYYMNNKNMEYQTHDQHNIHEYKTLSEKQKSIKLSMEKKTENKKTTHSNSRYCNFKLRQRPKRVKNKPAPIQA